jgi:hypothetical protein
VQQKRRNRRWLKFGLAAIALVGILAAIGAWYAIPYAVPFDTLLKWSRADMDAYAAKVMAPGSTALANPPKRIGYFNVVSMEPLPHGFLFQHDSGNPFDWLGIAYSEQPLPNEEKDAKGEVKQIFRPLGGNWYFVFRP